MAKIMKKSKLKFKNGHLITKKGKIVHIEPRIVNDLYKLEDTLQKYDYLRQQPAYQEAPSLNGFKRKSALTNTHELSCSTPLLDKKHEEAMQIESELNIRMTNDRINALLENYSYLLDWLMADEILVYTDSPLMGNAALDLYMLGNPLELEAHEVVEAISQMCGDMDVSVNTMENDRIIMDAMKNAYPGFIYKEKGCNPDCGCGYDCDGDC